MIAVVHAPPFATIQDTGRTAHRADGVPPGGAMDGFALRGANALLGNAGGAAAIEWALGGGEVRFESGTGFVLAGAAVQATLDGAAAACGRVHEARAGALLRVERFVRGRFLYVCVAGGIDVPLVLGGRGTYLPGAFGGLNGRRLRAGDVLPLGAAPGRRGADAELPDVASEPARDQPLALLRGPQGAALGDEAWTALLENELAVSPASDRTGYRLEGGTFAGLADAERKSEPTCPGAVQLTPKGELIVLMADGPTVAGYPVIGVVASADLHRLAQRNPGDRVRFRAASAADARAMLEARHEALSRLARGVVDSRP